MLKKVAIAFLAISVFVSSIVYEHKKASANPLAVAGAAIYTGYGAYTLTTIAVATIAGLLGYQAYKENLHTKAIERFKAFNNTIKNIFKGKIDAAVNVDSTRINISDNATLRDEIVNTSVELSKAARVYEYEYSRQLFGVPPETWTAEEIQNFENVNARITGMYPIYRSITFANESVDTQTGLVTAVIDSEGRSVKEITIVGSQLEVKYIHRPYGTSSSTTETRTYRVPFTEGDWYSEEGKLLEKKRIVSLLGLRYVTDLKYPNPVMVRDSIVAQTLQVPPAVLYVPHQGTQQITWDANTNTYINPATQQTVPEEQVSFPTAPVTAINEAGQVGYYLGQIFIPYNDATNDYVSPTLILQDLQVRSGVSLETPITLAPDQVIHLGTIFNAVPSNAQIRDLYIEPVIPGIISWDSREWTIRGIAEGTTTVLVKPLYGDTTTAKSITVTVTATANPTDPGGGNGNPRPPTPPAQKWNILHWLKYVLDWFVWLILYVVALVTLATTKLSELASATSGLQGMLASYFASLPPLVLAVLVLGVSTTILGSFIGRRRG